MIFVILAFLSLLKSPEIGRNSCLRHAGGNYFELNYFNYILQYCDYLTFSKKKSVMLIWLICDSLPFYAHLHTGSLTVVILKRNKKRYVNSETVCLVLLIKNLIVSIRL